MSLSSELRRWVRYEWRFLRWLLAASAALGVFLAFDQHDIRLLIVPTVSVAICWFLWVLLRATLMLVGGSVGFAVGTALRPLIRARQSKEDVARDMRKLPFEQR